MDPSPPTNDNCREPPGSTGWIGSQHRNLTLHRISIQKQISSQQIQTSKSRQIHVGLLPVAASIGIPGFRRPPRRRYEHLFRPTSSNRTSSSTELPFVAAHVIYNRIGHLLCAPSCSTTDENVRRAQPRSHKRSVVLVDRSENPSTPAQPRSHRCCLSGPIKRDTLSPRQPRSHKHSSRSHQHYVDISPLHQELP
jgi:hypothetical protein